MNRTTALQDIRLTGEIWLRDSGRSTPHSLAGRPVSTPRILLSEQQLSSNNS
jgi:hypothetical protein